MVDRAYCPHCGCDVPFNTRDADCVTKLDGVEYTYKVKQAVCERCGGEAIFAPFEEEAGRAFNEAVREQKGLVSLAKIQDMPKRYNIGKRPLSLLLGWGEITYTRFMDGQVPSREYSDVLERLYEDPAAYYRLLAKGKNRITQTAFRKSEEAVAALLEKNSDASERLYEVADYFCILSEGDITTMMLQKLTYYAQGFSYVFLDSPLFEQRPSVSDYGPVYRQIAEEYQGKDLLAEYGNLKKVDLSSMEEFNNVEEELLNAVFGSFGRYSGSVLTQIAFTEDPIANMKSADKRLSEDRDHGFISLADMKSYFSRVADSFKMGSCWDITKYADEAFSRSSLVPTG